MKKNLLKIYEGFFDDLDKLNPNQNKEDKEDKVNDEFSDVNGHVYDEYDYIISPYKNPEFFEGLCNMCKDYQISYNENGFTQKDLNQITKLKQKFNDWSLSYFKNVISLDELQYFHNLKEINYKCFSECKKLKSIILPKNLEIIYEYSFEHCSSLKEIVIPEKVKIIDDYAFLNCISLKKLSILNNIKKIGRCSFAGCSSLKEIVIPESVKKINMLAFNNCSSLEKITILNKNVLILFGAFDNCSSLKELIISKNYASRINVFFHKVDLTKVNITYI